MRLYVQWFFPGEKWSETKHKDCNSQIDFTYKHTSHDTNQTKKHVLACSQHQGNQDTKDLLDYTNQDAFSDKN